MAKRKRARERAPKTDTLTLTLPRSLWLIINDAARIAGTTPDQVVSMILALRFVTMPKDRP